MWVCSLGQEDPLEEGHLPWQPTPVFLPGESHGQRSLVGYRPWSCKSDTTEVTQHMKLKTKNLSVILVVATFYSLIAQTVKNLPAMQVIRVQSLGQEDPLEKGMATHSSILAWRSHGQRSLVVAKSQARLSN